MKRCKHCFKKLIPDGVEEVLGVCRPCETKLSSCLAAQSNSRKGNPTSK